MSDGCPETPTPQICNLCEWQSLKCSFCILNYWVHYRSDKKQWYAKQKHLGCKNGKANQKQQLSDLYIRLKALISAKAKN